GKSTIITALTGRGDIPIDADVCTGGVTAYEWEGIRILDTPGIHAGHPDHDEMTYAAIDQADLLVFTVTNELFDDIIGEHFRDLAYGRSKSPEMMLVVNKMSQDPGTPKDKIPDIEKVTDPLDHLDFRTVFIDALACLEAEEEEDLADRADLLEIANMDDLTSALNDFVGERGLLGRLTTPLFSLRAIAEQAHGYTAVDFPEERAALELLHRKRCLLTDSRSRLRAAMTGLVDGATLDIIEIGDEVAEAIAPGGSETQVKALHNHAQEQARDRCGQLAEAAKNCINSEMNTLHTQLRTLQTGVLATELQQSVGGLLGDESGLVESQVSSPSWTPQVEHSLADWPGQAKRVGDIAKNIGKHATQWSTGPFASGAATGSATATRGSELHLIVYDVGRFFGVKFQPWGAVKIARYIGNAGRVIGAIGGVLAVVAQIAEDCQNDRQRVELRDARIGVRSAYRASAGEVEAAFRERLAMFESTFYDTELGGVAEMMEGLIGKRQTRSGEASLLKEIANRSTALIEEVQPL
ncbi:MAG: hypothetical protein HN348_25120, partial [Proteobacteria bacterium]|nr:hypothetical protein [Pseudomonadota bacterium]